MRTEFKIYYAQSHKKVRKRSIFQKIGFSLLKRRIKRIDVGSEEWVEMEYKLGALSTSTFDCEKREFFFRHSFASTGKNLCVMPLLNVVASKNVSVGDNVYINARVSIVAKEKITIGNNVLIGPNVIINSGSHIFSNPNVPIREQGHKTSPIVIEDDVWIGANCIILPGVTIGKGSVVGANSLVNRSVEPYSVIGGSPAKLLKKRE